MMQVYHFDFKVPIDISNALSQPGFFLWKGGRTFLCDFSQMALSGKRISKRYFLSLSRIIEKCHFYVSNVFGLKNSIGLDTVHCKIWEIRDQIGFVIWATLHNKWKNQAPIIRDLRLGNPQNYKSFLKEPSTTLKLFWYPRTLDVDVLTHSFWMIHATVTGFLLPTSGGS